MLKGMIKLKIVFTIKGKPNYLRWTLEQWFKEINDIIRSEYGVDIDVKTIDSQEEYPIILFDDEVIFEGLPGEEGYLIEIVKSVIERKVGLKPRDIGV